MNSPPVAVVAARVQCDLAAAPLPQVDHEGVGDLADRRREHGGFHRVDGIGLAGPAALLAHVERHGRDLFDGRARVAAGAHRPIAAEEQRLVEAELAKDGRSPEQSDLAEMDGLWDAAKAAERG